MTVTEQTPERSTMTSKHLSPPLCAKAAFGLALLTLAAVVGASPEGPEESASCVFAEGSNPQAIETSVRNWARASNLGAVSQWNVSLDGPHGAVELAIDTGTLTISWQLDADCTPTNVNARGSAAAVVVPAQATLRGLAAGLPALHTRHGGRSIPWTPLTLLAMLLAILFAVVRARASISVLWRRLKQRAFPYARAVAGRVLLAIAGFGIGLAFAEIATRATGLHTHMMAASLFYIRGDGSPQHRTSDDAFLHYELNPNSHTTLVGPHGDTFDVNIDALGARLPTHARAKPAGVFRILAFGGSTLFGANVNDDETMAAAMERRLNRSGAANSNRHFEVWNFGTSAYNLAQAAHLARKHLVDLDSDLLCVQLHNRFPRPFYLESEGEEEEVFRTILERDALMLSENFPSPASIPETLHAVAIRHSALYQVMMGLYRRRVRPQTVSDTLAALEAAALVREATEKHVDVAFVAIPSARGTYNGDNAVYEGLPKRNFIDLYRPGHEAEFYEVHPPPRVLDEFAGLLIEELEGRDLIPQH